LSSVRLIAATGKSELDAYLAKTPGIEVIAEVYYREALTDVIRRKQADVALLSAYLPGQDDVAETIWRVRAADVRVVFLAGEMRRDDPIVYDLLAMGVYDILFGRLKAEDIVERIRSPATFGQAVRLVRSNGPEGNRLMTLLRRLPWPAGGEGSQHAGSEAEEPAAVQRKPGRPAAEARRPTSITAPRPNGGPREGAGAGEVGDEGPLRPPRPVIAVWSPAPCGKTTVAVNLARALSERMRTALVDLDMENLAVHTWLLLPEGENVLAESLSRTGMEPLPEGYGLKPSLKVYALDPRIGRPAVTVSALARMFASPQVDAEVLVVDMPSVLPDWGKKVIESAAQVILVADQDYAHLIRVREALSGIGSKATVVLNGDVCPEGVEGWDVGEILGGVKPKVVLPHVPAKMYGCIAEGKFAYDADPVMRKRFEELAEIACTSP